MIFKSANAQTSGIVDRIKLKEAMIENSIKMNEITGESYPKINPIIEQVMNILNSIKDGTIK